MRLLDPARGAGESQAAYRQRRRIANLYVKRKLKGTVVVPSPAVHLVPPVGTDPEIDRALDSGKLVLCGYRVMLYEVVRIDKDGMPTQIRERKMRVVREKGVPYVKPEEPR